MIPTAEDFLWNREENVKELMAEQNYQEIYKIMIDFTKLHVEAAKKNISEVATTKLETYGSPYPEEWRYEVDKSSILNAYPLENIK